MEPLCLTVNLGSASKKYALFRGVERLATAHFEKMPTGFALSLQKDGVKVFDEKEITESQYHDAAATFKEELDGVLDELAVIGVRVVAPGSGFQVHAEVTAAYEEQLAYLVDEAPLHITPLLEELGNLHKSYPKTPVMGISDSVFHRTLPSVARLYGLPSELAHYGDYYRFGYHGLSLDSVVRHLGSELPPRAIVLHLGSGASVTALLDGKSVDTSMGFTPLEGLLMSTRCGSIDGGLVLALVKKLGIEETEQLLERKSGLLGVSGASGDIRALLKREENGDAHAHEALELFVRGIVKHVGAAVAVLGGIDALIFTGTIGERSFVMRRRIIESLAFLDLTLDDKKNNALPAGGGAIDDGGVSIQVVPAKEDDTIARESLALLAK